jgi:hypothetical protein
MVPLGLQMTTVGSLGGPGMMGDPGGAARKPDPLWECGDWGGSASLRPLTLSTSHIDNNDMWNFTNPGTVNYTLKPEDDSLHVAEGFWYIHTTGSPNLISITGCGS